MLRRVLHPNQFRRNPSGVGVTVSKAAFKVQDKDRGQGLSVSACCLEDCPDDPRRRLATIEDVEEYLDDHQLKDGRRLGAVFVARAEVEQMALTVVPDPLSTEPRQWGHLHALIANPAQPDRCPTVEDCSQLALFASGYQGIAPRESECDP
jgi:hypothetical protein